MANRTVAVSLIANVGGYISNIARASAATNGLGNSTRAASQQVQSGFGAMSKGAALLGGAVAVGLGVAVKSALDFEKSMRNVNSLLGLSADEFQALNGEVLALADRMPLSAQTLADGLYEIASSGFDGAEGLMILEQAAVAATAGMTDADTAAGAITAVLNAYGREANDAADVSDTLFSTVNYGVITFEELSSTIGGVVGTAAAAKVPIEDVGAALATMTLTGISGAEAGTSMNRVLQSLIDPSEALAGALQDLGYQSGAQALESDGLRVVMDKLREATGGNITALLKLFPEIRAARGALALMSDEGRNYARVAGEMEDETARAGATQEVFNEQMKATANQAALVGSSLEVVGIQVGTALLPVIGKLIQGFGMALAAGRDLASEIGERLAPFFESAAEVGEDFWELLTEIAGVVGPVAGGLAAIGGAVVITALNALGEVLSAVTGFLADNEEIAFALATMLAITLVGGISAVTGALWTMVGVPVLTWTAMTLIPALSSVATFLTGGFSAALIAARTALMGLLTAAAPLLAVGGIVAIGVAAANTTDAADDARAAIENLMAPIEGAETNAARIAAMSEAFDGVRRTAEEAQDALDEWNSRSLLEQINDFSLDDLWDDDGDELREAAELAQNALADLEDQMDETDSTTEALARRFNISGSDVLALADQLGVDLATGGDEARESFIRLNNERLSEENARVASELSLMLSGVPQSADQAVSGLTGVGETAGMTTEQMEEATKRIEEWREATAKTLGSFTEPLSVYRGLLEEKTAAERAQAEATAAATESGEDSWEDYVGSVSVSLNEYADRLRDQIQNQMEWRDNLVQVAAWAGSDVAQILMDMGAEGVDITAQMAEGMTAETRELADLLIQDAHFAGQGVVGELQAAWLVADAVSRQGAAATAQSVADELGIGVGQVAQIADRYGLVLADGINPILSGLGKASISVGNRAAQQAAGRGFQANADGNLYESHHAEIAPGGAWRVWAEPETGGEAYIPLAASKRSRSMNIWRETGRRLGASAVDFYAFGGISDVPAPFSTAPYRMPISTAGDAVMEKGFDEVKAWLAANLEPPAASGGSSTGLTANMAAARQYVMDTYGIRNIGGFARRNIAGTNVLSDHAMGKAIDIMTTNLKLGWTIADDFAFGRAHDLFNIENTIWQQSISSNGRRFVGMADRGSPTQNHRDHVHADQFDRGGVARGIGYLPKATVAPERVLDPRQTVAFEQMVSREFSGATGGGGAVQPVVVQVEGARLTGRLEMGTDGIVTLVDGRIEQATTSVNRGFAARGVR